MNRRPPKFGQEGTRKIQIPGLRANETSEVGLFGARRNSNPVPNPFLHIIRVGENRETQLVPKFLIRPHGPENSDASRTVESDCHLFAFDDDRHFPRSVRKFQHLPHLGVVLFDIVIRVVFVGIPCLGGVRSAGFPIDDHILTHGLVPFIWFFQGLRLSFRTLFEMTILWISEVPS